MKENIDIYYLGKVKRGGEIYVSYSRSFYLIARLVLFVIIGGYGDTKFKLLLLLHCGK